MVILFYNKIFAKTFVILKIKMADFIGKV